MFKPLIVLAVLSIPGTANAQDFPTNYSILRAINATERCGVNGSAQEIVGYSNTSGDQHAVVLRYRHENGQIYMNSIGRIRLYILSNGQYVLQCGDAMNGTREHLFDG